MSVMSGGIMASQQLSAAANRDIGTITPVDATFTGATHDLGPLLAWQAALAKRDTTPVDILCIGTSVTMGLNASPIVSKCWTNLLVEKLRANLQPPEIAGGAGYTDVGNSSVWYAEGGAASAYGLGGNAKQFTAPGLVSLAFTGTGIDIWYTGVDGGGTFSWEIDGGTATNVSTQNATTASLKNSAIRGLTSGAHSLTLRWVSGTVILDGATVFNGDESVGIRAFNGGKSGAASADRAASAYSAGQPSSHWLLALDALNPDLVVIELGTNDWYYDVPAASFRANLDAIVAGINSLVSPAPSILLVALFQRGNATPVEPWQSYVDVIYSVAKANPNIQVIDFYKLSQRYDYGTGDTLGLVDSDDVHLTNAGASWFADQMSDVVWGGVRGKTNILDQGAPVAALPTAPSVPGQLRVASDLRNSILRSDGAYWNPLNGHAVIANAHNVNATINNLSRESLTKIILPGGFMRAGSRAQIWARVNWPAVGGATRTLEIYADAPVVGVPDISRRVAFFGPPIGSSSVSGRVNTELTALGTTGMHRGGPSAIENDGGIGTNYPYAWGPAFGGTTVDFTVPWEITFVGISCAETAQTGVTATWAAGVATYTKTAHGLAVGNKIVATTFTPTGYNGTLIVTSVPTANTWTAAVAVDPGGAGTGGTTSRVSNVTLTDYLIEWLQ